MQAEAPGETSDAHASSPEADVIRHCRAVKLAHDLEDGHLCGEGAGSTKEGRVDM